MLRKTFIGLFCCLSLALVASTAHAADTDDRVTLRLGAMNVDAQGELRGSTVFEGNDLAFSEDFDFGRGGLACGFL